MEINIEKMAHNVAEAALDSFEYYGKTIREWMKIIVEQEPCDYAVSHEAVRKILEKYHLGESRMAEELNELPPVTQKSEKSNLEQICEELAAENDKLIESLKHKSGKWIAHESNKDLCYCSECKTVRKWTDNRFCGFCGAKMVKPQESEVLK